MDIQFGGYRLKRSERLLLGPEGIVELSARSFEILAKLLSRPDAVVGKSELLETVWPGLVVEENTLQVHMSALRKALAAGMIMTVHGRGYKYTGPRPLEVDAEPPGGPSEHGDLAGRPASVDYKPVIAVLPFNNMSGDTAQDYFSAGITEDIIVELSRYRPLNVLSWHSSSSFKGGDVDIADAGKRLGARYLVEGSVRKLGDGIRVTAQLLEAATGSHVWAERYDRQLPDAFSVQDDLVRRIVGAITGHVERHTDSRAQAKGTASLDAYDCWVRAIHGGDVWTLEGNETCKRLLEEAIRRDALFARAHAGLAFCHIRCVQMMPGSEDIPMHEEAALRSAELAVRLDASEARAHNALGWSHMYFREFERARSSFLISASLNPNDGSACIDRALALAFLGEQNAADETAEIAATLNPLGGEWFSTVRAIVHFMAGRYEAAQQHFALGQTTLPDILAWHAANLTCLGRHAQAQDVMQQALKRCRLMWCGREPMKPEGFVGWFRHANMLRRPEDWDHVYNGFPKAELVSATQ